MCIVALIRDYHIIMMKKKQCPDAALLSDYFVFNSFFKIGMDGQAVQSAGLLQLMAFIITIHHSIIEYYYIWGLDLN